MPQQTDPIRQFRLAVVALAALIVLGTFGYQILEDWPTLDALYMTVITLATVGYAEVHPLHEVGRMFTIALVVFGVTIVFWAAASLVEAVVGEQIWHAIQRKRMRKHISKLHEHFIVCGFGRMGQQIVRDLQREGVQHCVIEINPEQLPKLVAQDIPFVEGNASDDEVLMSAGIESAKGLITVAPSDQDNVFITLSARALNPGLFIVARSILEENEDKIKIAGADRVMSPYVLGGRRMATAMLRPNVLDFLELAMQRDDLQIMLEEITIGPNSSVIGQSIEQSSLKTKTGVTVVAMKKSSGKMIANPSADEVLEDGDLLVILGLREQLDKAKRIAAPDK